MSWTIRMPEELAQRIRDLAAALTAKGGGRWTGNMLAVRAIQRGLDAIAAEQDVKG